MTLGDILSGGLNIIGGDNALGQMARGLIGAGIGSHFTPRLNIPAPIPVATLDASTIPLMQRESNIRMANLQGYQGAKGGLSSSDLYERNNLRTQLSQRIAQQHAFNQISNRQQAYNNAIAQNAHANQRLNNMLSAGAGLASFGHQTPVENGNKKKQQTIMQQLLSAFGNSNQDQGSTNQQLYAPPVYASNYPGGIQF